jgi:SSS family solute:Na+ symporter
MGLIRLAIDTPVKFITDFAYREHSLLWIINSTFFQYYSLLIFVVCVIVMLAVSYATKQPDYEKINGLTYSTTSKDDKEASKASWTMADVFTSGLVIVLIIAMYIYFSG